MNIFLFNFSEKWLVLHVSSQLWWSGNKLNPELLNIIRPEVAIASADSVHPDMIELFKENNIPLFWTGRDGAIQWTPITGFQSTLELDQSDSSFL